MITHNEKTLYQTLAQQFGTPLLILDCAKLREQYQRLQFALPGVRLYYALKACANKQIIETLNQCGANFDIATSGEINLLRKSFISPTRTIHTHPIKTDKEIRAALRFGCTTFVVDNPYELEKFAKYRHRVGLMLRLSFPDKSAVVQLSKKFGCEPDQAMWLIRRAQQLKLTIKGLCFHVGSQAADSNAYVKAIQFCNNLIQQAEKSGMVISLLDIGGGFPVCYEKAVPSINEFCQPITQALQKLPKHIEVIAEPGRFLVAPAMTAITRVVGKANRGGHHWYYLDDGVYGAFSGQIYDHALYPIEVFENNQSEKFPSVLSGPTCDSIDVVRSHIELPELKIGDLVIGRMMGAYTIASATTFNGIPKAKVVAINFEEQAAHDAVLNQQLILNA